jgi:hypothetical protein
MACGLRRFEASTSPLDLLATPDTREQGVASCEGGFVPEGKALVVTRATYWGTAKGDSNGDGGFALVIGGESIADHEGETPLVGTWTGAIEVAPGEEMLTYLELRNSSVGEVELFGELVDRPGLLARARPAPPRKPRKPTPPAPSLREPKVWLQGRNGAGGGNPFRVTLDGQLSYFRELSPVPLDLETPIDIYERGLAHCVGGVVPAGQIFVVTRVVYYGFARGDSNGPGGFAIEIGGERILDHERPEPTQGTWVGRIEIEPGDEENTYLEVRNSSAGEATLYGEFVSKR